MGDRMYITASWSVVFALDAHTGRQRWTWDPAVDRAYGRRSLHRRPWREAMGDAVGGGVMAAPVTYAIDGRQYVSVLAGWGGAYGVLGKSSRQPFPGRVLTFALGGGGTLPGAAPAAPQRPEPIPFTADAAQVAEGAATYARYCSVCHDPQAVSGGVLPDLRLADAARLRQYLLQRRSDVQ